jgi:hypothetical protein
VWCGVVCEGVGWDGGGGFVARGPNTP